jgi:hypothetical protein
MTACAMLAATLLLTPARAEVLRSIARLTYDDSPDGVLRVSRAAGEWRRVDVAQKFGPLDRGAVTLSWTQTIERYEQGPTQPNAETLYTVRLLNDKAQSFFHLAFAGTKQGTGGPITAQGAKGELGKWKPGVAQRFVLELNLEANTCSISIDGELRARDIPVNRPGKLNHVQFRDGTGLGLQDGTFTIILDDIDLTHADVSAAPLERHRRTPPNDNAVPAFNPKPADERNWTVPGEVRTGWVGNTFGGASGDGGYQNGFGSWVQNGIAPGAFAVTPDGTVVAGVGWDEAGRCIGLHKDGKVNTRLVAQYDMRGGHRAWGFGTATRAVAADGEWLYAGNTEGDLLRFRWTPGELDSHRWFDQLELGKEWTARALAARDGLLAGLFATGDVRLWRVSEDGFAPVGRWTAPAGARALCVDPDGGLWVVASNLVVKVAADGVPVPGMALADAGKPSAVSVAPDGTLLVCDNGPRQQVRFYDVSGAAPRFLRAFGEEGGLRSGSPGAPGPRKLYGLAGAGLDAAGNLYVGCCLHPHSRGTAVTAFDAAGAPLWNLECHAFTDGYSFDPASDGNEIVGVDELITLDPGKSAGHDWSLKALTLDPLRHPDDPRLGGKHTHCAARLRHLEGRRLLYTIGMQSGGFDLFAFEESPSQVAFRVGRVGKGTWAWEVDAKGDVWCGDAGGREKLIERHRFLGWTYNTPKFATDAPDRWPVPAGLRQVCRTHYDVSTDSLYLGAYPSGVKEPSWGLMGSVLERYDGWSTGKPVKRWRAELPLDDEKLCPKAMDIAGDYAFVVAVKPSGGIPALISVFALADGAFVGQIWPGRDVGGSCGWVDLCHAIAAHRRADGEYLILLEDDARGKNILYRWRPTATSPRTVEMDNNGL